MILALYGAGAMGREFRQIAVENGEWSQIVFIDDYAQTQQLYDCPVYRFQQFRQQFKPEETRFIISIGEPKFRLQAFEQMTRAGYEGGILIHPSAYISPDAEIGKGTAICHGVYIGSLSKIGSNCYLSRNASVGHDAVVGDHTRLGVNSFIGGHAVIGTNAFIGAGALLKDRIHVGNSSVVAMGAAVFEDVPDSVTVIGNPARISGEGVQDAVFAPGKALEQAKKEEALTFTSGSIAERYWEVFSDCFDGVDFNPVTFRYQDPGWDSVTHMMLISKLEEAFQVSIGGREVMRMKSYGAGLELIRKKLEKADGGH